MDALRSDLAQRQAELDAKTVALASKAAELPSGRLQEAGSVIWSDASTLGYRRGLAQDASKAMFRRDVDYCSDAFLLTPMALWKQLGGFDEVYAPAYYEEADYCMRMRQAGHRAVYEPAAVVDHYEFGSETRRGEAVRLMLRNRKCLRALGRRTAPVSSAVRRNQHAGCARAFGAGAAAAAGDRQRGAVRFLGRRVSPRALLYEAADAGWSVTFFPFHQLGVDWTVVRGEMPWDIEIISDQVGVLGHSR